MKARIQHQPVEYHIEGESQPAEARVLLASDQDLTAGQPWSAAGYTVASFLSAAENARLREGLAEKVRVALRAAGAEVAATWPVEQYHQVVGDDQALHLAIVNQTKEYPLEQLPVPVARLEQRVSELCGRAVRVHNPHNGQRAFHLRLARPGRTDNNPLHRDVWLDRLRDGLNIYFPVAGSTSDSSLTLVPGSHWWPEDRTERTAGGATYNGTSYSVPALKDSAEPLELVRPNPGPEQVLLFSPYLLHGGALNLNSDATRISLEIRFWAV
ncbi:phytanoyl-CoA dioxygenase family protein [Hymenobacter sp. HSC-4F20]|uniref:phytanoyl-CoA dioxygenase family protein n=1 Tax=Hymenobacter sp. HSC-4F20 TaxID=2864135 RepID=UPI001C735E1D|nr:phytanoyl-CoA dioxygenase family protein [Hymenobacter sp. HSC-4F20]MBX0291589.1 phytanoyl-CoA dioxygenase family protein [Hymenobacter sp. HSC-4F20]